jgi:hypothetical protein
MTDSPLHERLNQLTAEERLQMERLVQERGETFVSANWGSLLEQLRYIDTL